MDTSFSSTSQRTLSDKILDLVAYLSQDDRDNRLWLNIKPLILNDLNTVLCEGPFRGLSALFFIADTPRGKQLLRENAELRGKIELQGLNAVLPEGEHKVRQH